MVDQSDRIAGGGTRRLRSEAPGGRSSKALAVVVALVALGVLALQRWLAPPSWPAWSAPVAVGGYGVVVAAALAARLGGRPWVPMVLAAAYAAVVATTRWPVVVAGGAVAVAVLSAVLALALTVPASTFLRAVRETLVAVVVATAGGFAAAGLATQTSSSPLDPDRFAYVVLALTLLSGFAMVYRLGAGLHGLGRRGYALAVVATALLALALVYTAAVGRYGSRDLVDTLDQVRLWTRGHLGAVPHPIEAMLGIPALCWGVFMRARRRQGWWVCAFGAAATAPATTRFVLTEVPAGTAALSVGYSLVVGLVLAALVIRVDLAVSGTRGRRARHGEQASAVRPEPGRFAALR